MGTALGFSRKSSSTSALAVPAHSSLITSPESRNSEISQVLYADNFAGEAERLKKIALIHRKQSLILAIFIPNPYFKIVINVLYILEIEKRYCRCSFDSPLMWDSHFDNKIS